MQGWISEREGGVGEEGSEKREGGSENEGVIDTLALSA